MTEEQLEGAKKFALYLDEKRNNMSTHQWNRKVLWTKPDAFQVWLQDFIWEQKNKINHDR